MTKPFLKWAGGKTHLLEQIFARCPTTTSRYVEPMVGAGAVLFALAEHRPNNQMLIGDLNEELINVYSQIKAAPEAIHAHLLEFAQGSEAFYQIRAAERSADFASWTAAQKAARTIYLNKLGFNGLYRVNASGHFNVPFGKRTGVRFELKDLTDASAALGRCEIRNCHYKDLCGDITENDWVYFDPPYLPINESSKFTEYNSGGFTLQDHMVLKEECDRLNSLGAKVLVSNSHSNKILELYRGYNISVVFAKRSINSNGSKRGPIPELLISNY